MTAQEAIELVRQETERALALIEARKAAIRKARTEEELRAVLRAGGLDVSL